MKRGPHSTPETHPGAGALLDWVEGKLSGAARRDVTVHLRGCPTCRSEAVSIEELKKALRSEALDRPPAELSEWAAGIPGILGQRANPVAALLRVVTDSWAALNRAAESLTELSSPLPALRSVNGSPPRLGRRRVLLSSDSCDLDLEIDYAGDLDPRRIRGQILPAGGIRVPWKGSLVRLVPEAGAAIKARTDRRGEFVMNRVRPGSYTIEIVGPSACASPALEV